MANKNRGYDSFYDTIFNDEEMEMLDDLSGEEYDEKSGGEPVTQVLQKAFALLGTVQDIERPHRRELELLVEYIITDYYKINDLYNIKFDLEIQDSISFPSKKDDDEKPNKEKKDKEKQDKEKLNIPDTRLEEIKRRLINSLTQGGSVRGTFAFSLFKEYLDDIDDRLHDKYTKLMNMIFSNYGTDSGVAFFLSLLGQLESYSSHRYRGLVREERETPGGTIGASYIEYDEESDTWTIVARGKTFSILLHETIKGLYELISQAGFTDNAVINAFTQEYADRYENEIEDIRYGKHIYDTLVDILMDNHKDDRIEFTTIRELFFVEIYTLPAREFISFIKNAVNLDLTSKQQRWVEETIDRLVTEIRNYESGIPGLGIYDDPGIDGDDDGAFA